VGKRVELTCDELVTPILARCSDHGNGSVDDLYVIGGRQRVPRSIRHGQQNWQGYDRGLVVGVDTSTQTAQARLEYETPPQARADDDGAISFQAGTREGDRLYVCTETEVLVYGLPRFELLGYVSLPWFNDVHHVRPTPDGALLVASAGLELVLEVTLDGEVRRMWNVLGEDPWERFDRSLDYRKLGSTKPHRAHPNFVFYIGDEIWATRFQQGDAVCLTTPGQSFQISERRIHDGVLHDGRLYFTIVDGTVVVIDAQTFETVETHDLNSYHGDRSAVLGWCRGVLVDGDRLWVGFSRIRPTRFRENVGWAARGFKHGLPAHIACYDLARGTCITEIELEGAGLSAVYSILPAAVESATGTTSEGADGTQLSAPRS
jgi:hypothetical protein